MRTAGEKLGYQIGYRKDRRPYEAPLKTNQGDFQGIISDMGAYYAVGSRLPRERKSRLAGDTFNLDLTSTTGIPRPAPAPNIGSAEIRNLDLTA